MSALSVVRAIVETGDKVRGIAPSEQIVVVPVSIFERLWDEVYHGVPVPRQELDSRVVFVNGAQVYSGSTVPLVMTTGEAMRWLQEMDDHVRR